MKHRLLLAAASSFVAASGIVSAQGRGWHGRGPIRLVMQFPPGGVVDVVSRLSALHLSQALCQNVVDENALALAGSSADPAMHPRPEPVTSR